MRAQTARMERLYRNTYNAYLRNDLTEVVKLSNEAFEEFKEDELLVNFAFLKSMAEGKQKDAEALRKNLIKFEADYTDTDLAPFAKKILSYIKDNDVDEMLKEQIVDVQVQNDSILRNEQEEKEIYFHNEDTLHFYVIVANTEFVDINRLRFNVINYNLDFFSNFNFNITSRFLTGNFSMVIVQPLSDASQAINYFQLINISDEIFENINKSYIEHFVSIHAIIKHYLMISEWLSILNSFMKIIINSGYRRNKITIMINNTILTHFENRRGTPCGYPKCPNTLKGQP
jgi:hypothetical protein